MAAINIVARVGALFLRGDRPKVVLGLPTAGPTAVSSSDTFTLTEGTPTVVPFTPVSDSDTFTLSSTVSLTAGHLDSDTFTLDDTTGSSTPTFVAAGGHSTSGAPSWTVNLPTGIAADDIIFAQLFLSGSGVASDFYPVTAPSGWTIEDPAGAAGQNGRVLLAWKRADGTEGGTTVTFSPTSGTGTVGCDSRSAVYRGVDWSSGPFDGSVAWGEEVSYTGDDPQPGLITATLPDELMLVFSFTFGGFVGSGDHFIPSDSTATQRYADYRTSGFTGINVNLADEPMPAGNESMAGTWGGLGTGKSMGWLARVLRSKVGSSLALEIRSSDSATLTSTSSVATGTPTAISDSDSATESDAVDNANAHDVEIVFFTETSSSTASLTDTPASDTDSATLTDTGTVTVPTIATDSDTFTLSSTATVVALTDSFPSDTDTFTLTEALAPAELASSDSFTFSENDGGPPGGGGAGDGGGTGSGGGPGITVTYRRRHGRHG